MSELALSPADRKSDPAYYEFEALIAKRVSEATGPMFTTTAIGLYDVFLASLPVSSRQHYNCVSCRAFVEKYGGLVHLDENGGSESFLWSGWSFMEIPSFFRHAVLRMAGLAETVKVTGVFLSGDEVWGRPETRTVIAHGGQYRVEEWTHLHGRPKAPFKHAILTADQAMAAKLEEYGMLRRGLADYPLQYVEQAVRVLEADALDRSEATLGVAKWLLDLHRRMGEQYIPRRRGNVAWRAVATAPAGWCHVRSTMISTLLDDIRAGLGFEAISRRWAAKMHPLKYQRPTAPPSDGVIKRANEIVGTMEAEGALARRFARLSDLKLLWSPRPNTQVAGGRGGVFDHLRTPPLSKALPLTLPPVKITWERFRATVLPEALSIDYVVQPGLDDYVGLVTAVNPDAPPILQWDGDPRNPVSWYVYHNGSQPQHWNLAAGAEVPVTGICLKPPFWHEPEKHQHHGMGAVLVLSGCRDLRYQGGAGFFPSCLRSEFHEVRSVMEAYALKAKLAGGDVGDANGLVLQKGREYRCVLRVRSACGVATYHVDRWE